MMDEARWFEELEREYREDPEYILHRLLYVVTDEICRAMQEQGISRSDLADRLGVSRQYITKFLNTPANTTLYTIVRFANALGLAVNVSLGPKTVETDLLCEWPIRQDARLWSEPPQPLDMWPSILEGGEEIDESGQVAA